MKLDAKLLRYLSSEEFRVLTAVEMGSKNHEVVPTPLIAQIAKLKSGGAHKVLGELAKHNLVARVQNAKYDGYRLTYGGYDYLALHTFAVRGSIHSVGNQIGVGKESDIYIVADDDGVQHVLKIHRLGRTSFRAVKSKRDYLESRKSASWMYMSRLAATKEYAFMRALHEHGFPVPTPIDQNRHCVAMSLVDGVPLTHVAEVADVGQLYADLMALLLRLAAHGLVHGDFNEFNLLVREVDQKPVLIDFPQMISTNHPNAKEQFDRDVECVKTYFRRRYNFDATWWPEFDRDVARTVDLDAAVSASGACKLTKRQQRELEQFLLEKRAEDDGEGEVDEDESESEAESEELRGESEPTSADSSAEVEQIGATLQRIHLDQAARLGNSGPASDLDDAASGASDDEEDEEAADQLEEINNKQFRAFRDTKGTLEQSTTSSRAPRMIKATKTLTPEDIKRRVAAAQGKSTKGSKQNLNKTRNRKEKAVKESIRYGKTDYE
ncbi:atypical/RIO/RIO2 protein kinase [Allomyces macrogynus ATCC 38327]|uniref:Serine/threonine-protein kinase RIO2 n=1 Tax=Allomyces macrogynus (strain ATCC 38327) TaxID=578462 RepID=A0A0L0SAJ2_ALLM3|nr:atypical/RIO/RIO2 protein kinase [Allomyces macrogynus ATCC 38327]|eukprot:KNE59588.1 atypical/RIO/RIO2 protein kinase [Allomyces macrogynus ATCC 38327]